MSQNISLWGATYSDVPSVELPKSGGGTASFTDISDTTATASDVANSKYIYMADGSKVQGSITSRFSSDLTASGATVTVPSGYYSAQASKSVVSGTAGTPTASKGTVSNHAVSVTPSVTNSSGYITGGTKNGTAVTVSASELVSGTLPVTQNGTADVTNYASVNVTVPSGEDIPVFTINLSTNPPTATCNKTFAECETLLNANNTNAIAYAPSVPTKVPMAAHNYVSNYEIVYAIYDAYGYPMADIAYFNGGTVSYYEPSTLNNSLPTQPSSTHTGTLKATIDRSTSERYLNIAKGYYPSDAYYTLSAVPNGTAGTPSATKGTVSNHSISVTPSVTNTTGYITGSTKTGTAVTVSASELVSGSDTVTTNDTYDVTNLAELIVNVSGGTSWQTLYDGSVQVYSSNPNYFQISPYTTAFQADQTYRVTWGQTQYLCNTIADPLGATYDGYLIGNLNIVGAGTDTGEPFIIYRNSATELTGGTSSSAGTYSLKIELQQSGINLQTKTKTYTPTTSQQTESVTADSGYDGLDTVSITVSPVTQTNLTAANIKNGATVTISNGTSNLWSVTGTYSGGTSKNAQVVQGTTRTTSSTLTAIGAELTVSKTGTYDVYWSAFRAGTTSSYTYGTQLYVGGTAYGTENTTWSNHVQNNHLTNVSLTANQKIRVYGRNSRGSSYYIYAPTLVIVES